MGLIEVRVAALSVSFEVHKEAAPLWQEYNSSRDRIQHHQGVTLVGSSLKEIG